MTGRAEVTAEIAAKMNQLLRDNLLVGSGGKAEKHRQLLAFLQPYVDRGIIRLDTSKGRAVSIIFQ